MEFLRIIDVHSLLLFCNINWNIFLNVDIKNQLKLKYLH